MRTGVLRRILIRCHRELARPRLAVAAALAYVASQAFVLWILEPLGTEALGLQTTLSGDEFYGILAGWNPEQVALYLAHFGPDFVHATIYAVALASAVACVTRNPDGPPSTQALVLFATPLVAGACDFAENLLHLVLISTPAPASAALVALSGSITAIKWMLALGTVAWLMLGGVAYYCWWAMMQLFRPTTAATKALAHS